VRDDYRCAVTGVRDRNVRQLCPRLTPGGLFVYGCHVICDFMVDPVPKKVCCVFFYMLVQKIL
jgi:hypothetical protein